jgi:hypothetical protein
LWQELLWTITSRLDIGDIDDWNPCCARCFG